MPDDHTALLRRLIAGAPGAGAEVLTMATSSTSATLLVAAALVSGQRTFLDTAREHAATTRDRQLVEVADARLRGDTGLVDVLVREHLCEHPDNLLASWIAADQQP